MSKKIDEKIRYLQFKMMEKYFIESRKLYKGEITDKEYKINRVNNVSLWYAQEMVKLGVANNTFTKEWIQRFAEDTLVIERNAVPLKDKNTELTALEGQALCKVAIEWGKKFFENFHNDFCPNLSDNKLIHDDYIDKLEEERRIVKDLLDKGEWFK